MRAITTVSCAAALAMASFAASSVEKDSIQACMESFAEQNFPGRVIAYQVRDDRSVTLPLIASTGTQSVEVVAADARSGRVIATANCKVKTAGPSGTVVVGMIESN